MDGVFSTFESWGIPTTWDAAVLLVLILGAFFYGLRVGRDRAVTILLATYLALAVVTNAPLLGTLASAAGITRDPTLQLVWFIGFFLLTLFVLWKSELVRNLSQERGAWWESAVFSLLQIGLTVSIVLSLLPPSATDPIQGVMRPLFVGNAARSFWLVAPIPCLFLLGRGRSCDDDE